MAQNLSELLEAIRRLASSERGEITRLRRRQQLWAQLETSIRDGTNPFVPLALIRELERTGKSELLCEIEQAIVQQCRDYLLDYGERFRQACTKLGLKVEGRLPSFLVNGVLRVEVDEERLQVTVGSRTLTPNISVEAVAEAASKEAKRLFNRPFDAEKFVAQLQQAYRHVLTEQGKDWRYGSDVSLLDVHRFMVLLRQPNRAVRGMDEKHFKPYPLDEFAVDLGKLLAAGNPPAPDGSRAHLGFVRDVRRALFVFNPAIGAGQHYGLIAFRKPGGEANDERTS